MDFPREQCIRIQVEPSLNKQAGDFLEITFFQWLVPGLIGPVRYAAGEMVTWLIKHGPCSPVTLKVTMNQKLLSIEMSDRGGLVPDLHVSKADAELAMWLLGAPAVEWGVGMDSRGRRFWIAISTDAATVTAPGEDSSEPLWQ